MSWHIVFGICAVVGAAFWYDSNVASAIHSPDAPAQAAQIR